MIRPRAERHSADLRVERPQAKMYFAEPDELRRRHPQHSAVVVDDARRVAVMLDGACGAAEREEDRRKTQQQRSFTEYFQGARVAASKIRRSMVDSGRTCGTTKCRVATPRGCLRGCAGCCRSRRVPT